jgi:hypothetical protein
MSASEMKCLDDSRMFWADAASTPTEFRIKSLFDIVYQFFFDSGRGTLRVEQRYEGYFFSISV